MLKKREMWYVVCDKCGEMYEDSDREWYWETKEEAKESIESDDRWEVKKGKFLCPMCQ